MGLKWKKLPLKKPFKRNILIGFIGQRSADGDRKCSAVELLKGDVDGVCKGLWGLHKYGGAHSYL